MTGLHVRWGQPQSRAFAASAISSPGPSIESVTCAERNDVAERSTIPAFFNFPQLARSASFSRSASMSPYFSANRRGRKERCHRIAPSVRGKMRVTVAWTGTPGIGPALFCALMQSLQLSLTSKHLQKGRTTPISFADYTMTRKFWGVAVGFKPCAAQASRKHGRAPEERIPANDFWVRELQERRTPVFWRSLKYRVSR